MAVAYAKTVTLFVMIDTAVVWFAIMTFGLVEVVVVIAAITAPVVGYLGAKFFRYELLAIYMAYLVGNVTFRAWLVARQHAVSLYAVAFGVVGALLELMILVTVAKFIGVIRSQSDEDLTLLRKQLHPCQLRLQ